MPPFNENFSPVVVFVSGGGTLLGMEWGVLRFTAKSIRKYFLMILMRKSPSNQPGMIKQNKLSGKL